MPKKLNKVCVICDDRASGFNFNAITCESCKAFFRRNALKEKSFRCLKGGLCDIDLWTRKNCKKCRLNKCFDRGMKTELILTEEQKELRKIKIRGNRETKIIQEITKLPENSGDSSCTESSNTNISSSLELVQFNWDKSDENFDEIKSKDLDSNEISESVYQEAVSLEFSVIPFQRPITNHKKFNELEISRLQELFTAMKALKTPSTTNILLVQNFAEAIKILCLKCDQEVRKIVKMSKNLNAFKNINETDQLILLKHSALQIIGLRLTEYFDLNGQHWIVITNTENANIIQLELLKNAKREYNLDFKRFYEKFMPEWDSDKFIIDLLTAIILFDPKRPRLNQVEPIRFQRNIYLYLFQRYLQIKYNSDSDSITKFLRLLNSLNDLHIIDDKLTKNFLEAGPQSVLPLLWEISNRNN